MEHSNPIWLTAGEVVERLRLKSRRSLNNMRYNGTAPPGTRIGHTVLYRRSDLETWEAARSAADPKRVPVQ